MSPSLPSNHSFSLLHGAGVLAWGLVSWILWRSNASGAALLVIALASAAYLLSFLYATYDSRPCPPRLGKRIALLLQFAAAVTLLLLSRNEAAIVLIIVAVSQLPWFVSMTTSLVVVAFCLAGHLLLKIWLWQEPHAVIAPLLYASFMLFAVVSSNQSRREQLGREETQRLWDPLESTCRHASLSIL